MNGGKRVWIGLLLSAIFVALFFVTVDFRRLIDALAGANYVYVVPGIGLYLIGVWFRTLRWRRLLLHIRPIPTARLFPVVVVGYMANNLLPLRLGELVRSYYVGDREHVSKAAALVTIFIERLLDALTLLLFILVIAIFVPLIGLAEAFGESFSLPWPLLAGAISIPFIVAFGLLVVVAYAPARVRALISLILRLLPTALESRIMHILDMFLEGLQSLKSPSTILVVFILSVPVWLFEACLFVLVGYSFGFHEIYDSLPELIVAMVLVTAIANIGASIPAGPGGIGLFELIARETLVLLPLAAIDRSVAGGYVAVVHACLLIPMIVLGQFFLWTQHISLRSLTKLGQGKDSGAGPMRIGIIGAGATGLTAAYELVKRGHDVVVYERAAFLGGQASTFDVGGAPLERGYHHLFTGDTDILDLIDEIGLGDRMRWYGSKVGTLYDGKIYNFVTPIDLLKFKPLSLVNRFRLGISTLLLRRMKDWQQLEDTPATDWLRQHAGEQAYGVFWGPMLRGKFGEEFYEQVGMPWIWGKINTRFASRGKSMSREMLGYPIGSFGEVFDVLGDRVREQGGEVHTNAEVTGITTQSNSLKGLEVSFLERDKSDYLPFDAVISTTQCHIFARLLPDLPSDYMTKLKDTNYLSAILLILVLDRPLSHVYWLNVADRSIPFVGVIEQTNMVDPAHYGGRHIVYLSNYLSRKDRLYRLSHEELLDEYLPHLRKINPEFDRSWIVESYRQHVDAAQPIIGTGYSDKMPAYRTPVKGVYLANTAQVYPEDRGTNYSVRMGAMIANTVMKDYG